MRTLTILVAACLVACSPSEPEAHQVEAPAADCARVADLFDSLAQRKATGLTEPEALAELSAHGDYALGYVVDGVFGDRFGPGGGAMARADTLAACRRLAAGGTLY